MGGAGCLRATVCAGVKPIARHRFAAIPPGVLRTHVMRFKVRENSGQLPARVKWGSSPLMGSRRSSDNRGCCCRCLGPPCGRILGDLCSQPQSEERLVEAPKEPPQLHCVLIRFTGEPRLSFLFDISQVGNELRFDQLYLVEISGSDKTVMQPPFPEWRFDASAEPARLESEISVFDNSAAGSHMEKITIDYQNLSGQCQQSRPVPLVSDEQLMHAHCS